MVRTIFLPPSIKAASEEGHRLRGEIDALSKKASSLQSTDRVIAREESDTRGRLEGLKKLVEQGLVLRRDEKATAVQIQRLTEELQGIQLKRQATAKELEKAQKEITALQKSLDEFFAIEIPEPAAPRQPIVHDAMSHSMTKSVGEKKEEKTPVDSQVPHHIVTGR